MDSCESDIESFGDSELSESYFEVEVDSVVEEDSPVVEQDDIEYDYYDDPVPYSEEPLADEAWITEYEKENEKSAQHEVNPLLPSLLGFVALISKKWNSMQTNSTRKIRGITAATYYAFIGHFCPIYLVKKRLSRS